MRLWFLADCGRATLSQQQVRDSYANAFGEAIPNILFFGGDNAYNSGTLDEYQAAIFNMYSQELANIGSLSTFGNHDSYSGANSNSQTGVYYDLFMLPKNGESSKPGGIVSNTEAYYSFDYGSHIHVVCLNSMDVDRSIGSVMLSWLEQDLFTANASGVDWIIAIWHHPPYSKGSHGKFFFRKKKKKKKKEEGNSDINPIHICSNYIFDT